MRKIILILFIFLLSGCYSYDEINNLAIISTIIIDYKDDNYYVDMEYIKPNKEKENESIIISSNDETLDKAIGKASGYIDKTLYYIDLNVLLITKDAVNKDMDSIIDYITRNNNFSFNFKVLIIDDKESIIELLNKDHLFNGEYIAKVLMKKENNMINYDYGELLEKYVNKNVDLIIPYGFIKDDKLIIEKAALIKNNKINNVIDYKNVQIYKFLSNNSSDLLYDIDDDLTIKIASSKTDITYKDGYFIITPKTKCSFNNASNIDIDNKSDVKKVKKELSALVSNDLNDFLTFLKVNDIDLLGLKKEYYNKTRTKLDNINNIKFKINPKIEFIKNGLTAKSIGDVNE